MSNKDIDYDVFFEALMGVLTPSNLNIEVVDSLGDTATSVVLPWTVTSAFFRDNPEGATERFSKLAGTQAGTDLWELIFDGDTDITDDALLKAMDGFHKLRVDTDTWTVKIAKDDFIHNTVGDITEYFMKLKIELVNNEVLENVG